MCSVRIALSHTMFHLIRHSDNNFRSGTDDTPVASTLGGALAPGALPRQEETARLLRGEFARNAAPAIAKAQPSRPHRRHGVRRYRQIATAPTDHGTGSDNGIDATPDPRGHATRQCAMTISGIRKIARTLEAVKDYCPPNSPRKGRIRRGRRAPRPAQPRDCARASRSLSVLTLARKRDSGNTICWASEASISARMERAPRATRPPIRSARSVRYTAAR
jgi:hypothetical protein